MKKISALGILGMGVLSSHSFASDITCRLRVMHTNPDGSSTEPTKIAEDAAMSENTSGSQGRIFTTLNSEESDGTTISGQLGCYKP